MKKFLLFIHLLFLSIFSNAQTELYFDDFETTGTFIMNSAGDNFWTINNIYTGTALPSVPAQPATITSANGNYLHPLAATAEALGEEQSNYELPSTEVISAAMTSTVVTTGYEDVTVHLWRTGGLDGLIIEYKVDGGAWIDSGHSFTGNPTDWQEESFLISAGDDVAEFSIRFTLDLNLASDPTPNHYHSIDDLSITGILMAGEETYNGCEGDGYSVVVNGTTYDESNPSGTEVIVGGASDGSDSTVVIDLIFNPNATSTESYTGCEGDGYEVIVNGTTYDEANPSGTETIVGGAANGCDSIVTIDLVFNAAATGTESYSGCEGDGYEVIVNGTTYDETNPSGTETIAGGGANGCDSIVTVDLTYNPTVTGIDNITACESYTWIDGNTYTTSNNTATHTLTSADGCDSIVTLNLTITSSLNTNVDEVVNSSNDIVLVAQQSNAAYQWLDCNNNYAIIPGANNQTFIANVNGSYAVRISKNGCVDTSNCIVVSTVSTSELTKENALSIHPNPSNGIFNVTGYGNSATNIVVMDALGRQIIDKQITESITTLDLTNKHSGIYFFGIIENDERSLRKVILK